MPPATPSKTPPPKTPTLPPECSVTCSPARVREVEVDVADETEAMDVIEEMEDVGSCPDEDC